MSKDYYKTLGVDRNASPEDLKKAFRSLAHKYHPDKGGDPERFKEVNEAYQVLGDPQKRQRYDQFGSAAFEPGAGGGPGGFGGFDFGGAAGFEDLSDLFGEMFGMGGQRGRAAKGQDIQVDVRLSFREAAFGTTRDIELYKTLACETCKGSGGEPNTARITCKTCKGSGSVVVNQRTMFGTVQTRRACPECKGQGSVVEKPCHDCRGTGTRKGNKTIRATIPAGIDDGEMVRLTGEGEAGGPGVAPGDLYLRIRVAKDPVFERDGNDLRMVQEIGFTTAALGGSVDVPTLESTAALKIPAGLQSGTVVRLRGKGIVDPRTGALGDQYVQVVVKTPEKLSKEQKKLLEELGLE